MAIKDLFKKKTHSIWDAAFPPDKVNNYNSLGDKLSSGIMSNLFEGLTYIMPNPDPVLKKLGWNYDMDAYEELMSDPQLYGAIENNRKPGTTSLSLSLENPDCPKDEMEYFSNYFDWMIKEDIYGNILNHSLDTHQYGRMVFGTVWDIKDGYFVPVQITPMPHKLCKFDYNGNFLISTDGAQFAPPDHPAKYIVLRHKPTIANPYGEALLSRCYWNIRFKKDGLKLWALFMEKFGMPWVKGSYNSSMLQKIFQVDAETAAGKFFDKLATMAKDGIIVFPEGTSVDLTSASEKSGLIYETMVRICDEQNTKLQLGHSGATESTSGDKLSNDTTATDVRKHVIDSDKKFPIALFNKLIYWIHTFNFAGTAYPKFDLYKEEDVDMSLATRDAALVPVLQLAGLKPSKKYMVDSYGFKDDDLETWDVTAVSTSAAPVSQQGAKAQGRELMFSELFNFMNAANKISPDQKIIDDVVDDSVADTSATDVLTKLVSDYLESKGDYKAALSGLAKLFPDMNTKELQDKLEQILFMADVVGRFAVRDELGV